MTAAKQLVDMQFMRSLAPLGELGQEQLQRLMRSYSVELMESGSQLFQAGDNDQFTYYVLSGQVALEYRGGTIKTVASQTHQARYALVPEWPRVATATAKSTVTVLRIERDALNDVMSWNDRQGMEVNEIDTDTDGESDWMTLFLQSKVFLNLRAQNIQALMMRLEEIPVQAGQIIIRQNDDDGYYYIIKKGHCQVSRRNSPQEDEVEIAVLTVGAGFGEEAIITHNRRGASVSMLDDGSLMRLSRNDFSRLLVEPLIENVSHEEVINHSNARYLDVRNYDDYVRDGISGSQNISLNELRAHIESLDKNKTYVAYSNKGNRAAAAAFLLNQQGIAGKILRDGLAGLPTDVKRGNQAAQEDNIPVVDNIINLKPQIAENTQQPTAKPVDLQSAMQDPVVKALFGQAKHKVRAVSEKAKQADQARQQAEAEVARLKSQAGNAKLMVEHAKQRAQLDVLQSAEQARLAAEKEAARLRELEVGALQAEMGEATRQAEEEAKRAAQAEKAHRIAAEEVSALKEQMQQAIANAQEEARKSAEAITQFAEQEARQHKKQAEQQAVSEALRAEEAEKARAEAEQEVNRLKVEAEITRMQLEERARRAAIDAQMAAKEKIDRLTVQAQQKEQEAVQVANAELLRLKEQYEQTKAEAELHAMQMSEQIREQARLEVEQSRAQEIADARRASELVLQEKQTEIDNAISAAEESMSRAVEAENQLDNIRLDAEAAEQQMHHQLSADIARSEIEHEVARARAIELANKQEEIEEISQTAEKETERAQLAESAKQKAEQEIANLNDEIERLKKQQTPPAQDNATEDDWQTQQGAEIAKKEIEIARKAEQVKHEAERAQTAEQTQKDAELEIQRLKAEVEIANLQARAQLAADNERTANQESELKEQTEALAAKQAKMAAVMKQAQQEQQRAIEAEQARIKAEQELQLFRKDANKNKKAQQELEKVRAHAQQQQNVIKAAESARIQADKEIIRLKKVAIAQRKKAENAIKASLAEPKQPAEPEQSVEPAKVGKTEYRTDLDLGLVSQAEPGRADEPKSQWVSDQVMWETTLGIREDNAVANIISPVDDTPEELKESLYTNIPSSHPEPVEHKAPNSYIHKNNASDFSRSKFPAQEVGHKVTAQIDSRSYIRSKAGMFKRISLTMFLIISVAMVGMYFSLSDTQQVRLRQALTDIKESGYDAAGLRESNEAALQSSDPVEKLKAKMDMQRQRTGDSISAKRKNTPVKRKALSLSEKVSQQRMSSRQFTGVSIEIDEAIASEETKPTETEKTVMPTQTVEEEISVDTIIIDNPLLLQEGQSTEATSQPLDTSNVDNGSLSVDVQSLESENTLTTTTSDFSESKVITIKQGDMVVTVVPPPPVVESSLPAAVAPTVVPATETDSEIEASQDNE